MHKQRTLAAVGEGWLLAQLRRTLGGRWPGVVCGIGDDAAVVAIPGRVVLTVDAIVEGVDFGPWARPADLGHKAAAQSLSDLAAMGASPRALLLVLALPATTTAAAALAMARACHRVGSTFGAPLIGGDLSATSGPAMLSVTAVGQARRRVLLRYTGRAGDRVWVSGSLGRAAAGLRLLQAGRRTPTALVEAQLRPQPRVALGEALLRARAVRSVADISDGLLADAAHVCAPGCGVELDVGQLPIDPAVRSVAAQLGQSAERWALSGGEDFELVMAVAPGQRRAFLRACAQLQTPVTEVGRIVRRRGVRVFGSTVDTEQAFAHFRA